jgi:hypothetical protein
MTETVTLAQVEALAARLPLTERLQLVAHVCEHLSVVLPALTMEGQAAEQKEQGHTSQLKQWLAECETVAELWTGEFDSAGDLRCMRDER